MSVVILVPSALSFSNHENEGAGKIHKRIAKIWLKTWPEKKTRQKAFWRKSLTSLLTSMSQHYKPIT